jgi:formylmethanofuran dehydrogenase subunit E
MMKDRDITYDEVVAFHGHSCPGLAIGYRMTQEAMEYLRNTRAEDEELVAIVENDACGTDALQYLSGCTFGKGNFIFHDYGKMVYTFYCRNSGKAIRVSRPTNARRRTDTMTREEKTQWILTAPADEVVNIEEVSIETPERARIFNSVECKFCGELVMETRARIRDEKIACIPCANAENGAMD